MRNSILKWGYSLGDSPPITSILIHRKFNGLEPKRLKSLTSK